MFPHYSPLFTSPLFTSPLFTRSLVTRSLVTGIWCLAMSSCQGEKPDAAEGTGAESAASKPASAKSAAAVPVAQNKPTTENFGATLTAGPTVKLAALLTDPANYADKTIITEGKIERACTRKGCWMEIAEGDSKCRVTFKNYGFFVPKDSAGASTRLQGTVTTRTVSAGRVKHLEEEGARFSNKQADGTAQEVRLIATAVQITR